MKVNLLTTRNKFFPKYVFWDCDSLTDFYNHPELLKFIAQPPFEECRFVLPTPVCTEFYNCKHSHELIGKREFLKSNSDYFKYIETPATVDENLLLLRRLYSVLDLSGTPSYSDLFLQALSVVAGGDSAILVKNLQDFHPKLFHIEQLYEITLDKNKSDRQLLCFVSVNKGEIHKLMEEYSIEEKKYSDRINKSLSKS